MDLLVCSLGVILICTQSVNAQTAFCRPQFISLKIELGHESEVLNSSCKDPVINTQAALEELAKADVVYLGETHDRLEDHQTQLQIIQELQRRNQKVAIAMEMFQRPYQDAIDHYLAGQLSEQELIQQTEYNQRWGFPWENHAPILRFAQEKQLPVLAVNVPTEITRQVTRSG